MVVIVIGVVVVVVVAGVVAVAGVVVVVIVCVSNCGGPIFYWGGFSFIVSWGVNICEGHPPLKTIFAIEIDAFLMKQL